jgi:hypothetical protein
MTEYKKGGQPNAQLIRVKSERSLQLAPTVLTDISGKRPRARSPHVHSLYSGISSLSAPTLASEPTGKHSMAGI